MDQKNAQIAQYKTSIAGQEEEVAKYTRAQAEAEAIIAAAEQSESGQVSNYPVSIE